MEETRLKYSFYTSVVLTYLPALGKIKVDICTLPCEIISKNPFSAKSLVSNESYEGFKSGRKGWTKFEKTKETFLYQRIYETDLNNLMKVEKDFLPLIRKELKLKLFFHPKYKKALCRKIKKLI